MRTSTISELDKCVIAFIHYMKLYSFVDIGRFDIVDYCQYISVSLLIYIKHLLRECCFKKRFVCAMNVRTYWHLRRTFFRLMSFKITKILVLQKL